jgi:hypothetical protein
VAYAAFTIDTADGSVDISWSPTPFAEDATSDAGANFDIDDAWIGTTSDPPTAFYFSVDLVGIIPKDGASIERGILRKGQNNAPAQ